MGLIYEYIHKYANQDEKECWISYRNERAIGDCFRWGYLNLHLKRKMKVAVEIKEFQRVVSFLQIFLQMMNEAKEWWEIIRELGHVRANS